MKKQLTINDCNIGTQFKFPKERAIRKVIGFGEFIDEGDGEHIILVEVIKSSANGTWHPQPPTYWNFDTIIKEIWES